MVFFSKPAQAAALALLCTLAPMANAACDPNGADHGVRRCVGGNCGTQIETCNWSTSYIQDVAPGTVCFDGSLVFESDERCSTPTGPTPSAGDFVCPKGGWFCKEQCGDTLLACSAAGNIGVEMAASAGTVCDNGALAYAADCDARTVVSLPADPTNPEVQQIFADQTGPTIDPNNGGWRFTNTNAGDKINWYFFPGGTRSVIPDKSIAVFEGLWVKFVMNSAPSGTAPWINLYTEPEASGNAASWYHTRVNYLNLYKNPANLAQGVEAVLYVGTAPNAADWAGLDGNEQMIDASGAGADAQFNANGRTALASTEIVKLIAFSTDSGATAGTLDFTVFGAGYTFDGQRTEVITVA